MTQIQGLTNDTLQTQTIILPDGTTLGLTLYFVPMQYGWFIQSLTYQNFSINGLRLTANPNLLYQFGTQLPFGIGCFTTNNRDPSQQSDFTSGFATLYLLTAQEVQQYEEYVSGQVQP